MIFPRIMKLFTRFGSSSRSLGAKRLASSLLTTEELHEILVRERMRSDRNGLPFSLLIISGRERPISPQELTALAAKISARIRATDDLGIFAEDEIRIGLALPETHAAGAWKLADDLQALCEGICGTLHFHVYAYPPFQNREDDDVDGEADERTPMDRPVRSLEFLLQQPLPAWKRGVDIIGAVIALLFAAPIMLLAGLAVRATSSGPMLFKQRREGHAGREFDIYKIRTMDDGADSRKDALRALSEQDGPAFKMTNDPRVTRVGAFLRKTSIDELPQLLNVLRGELSLVGPRPLPCDESRACEQWQRRRLDVTPGITCIWQVEGRSRVTFYEWMRMDLRYAVRRSIYNDMKLLLATVPAVLLRRGAK